MNAAPDSLIRFERVEADRAHAARERAGRALVVRGTRVALDRTTLRPHFVPHAADDPRRPPAFLGIDAAGGPLFVHLFDDTASDAELAALGLDGETLRWSDLRMELGRYGAGEREALVTALALARWSRAERFCAGCGSPLVWEADGRTKRCTRDADPHRHFPRTDPATIVLVHDGERALLGRQATWPSGLYSTLAGFVEAGETAEDSVAREVYEEVGVRVGEVRYVGSEAWPFPRSLMLGFTARALDTEVRVGEELEDARWFSRDEVAAMQELVRAQMPHFDTIARRLMSAWVAARA